MVTVKASGTLATSGSEQYVGLQTYNGVNILTLDLSGLVDGDVIVVRAYRQVVPGGNPLSVLDEFAISYASLGNKLIWQSMPYSMPYGSRFGIVQTVGTTKNVPWEIAQIGEAFVEQQGILSIPLGFDTTFVSSTSGKLVVCVLNLATLADGNGLRFRSRREILNGGTRRIFQEEMWSGAQVALNGTGLIFQSIPYLASWGGEFIVTPYGASLFPEYSVESFDE